MAESTLAAGSTPASMNLMARIVGVLTEPRATFANVAAHPKVLGVLCLTVVLSAFAAALPLMTEEGRQAAVEQQVTAMEAWGNRQVDEKMYAQLQKQSAFMPYITGGSILVIAPIVVLILSGILFAVFSGGFGGTATFKQVLAVVVHAGVVSTVGGLFSGAINYFRGGSGSATNLSALVPFVEETSFIGRLAGAADVFLIWWLIVLAIGLAVLYRRKTQPIAITLLSIYGVIALAIAAFMSR